MTPELWSRISEIFDAALERPAGERQAFLEHACPDNPLLLARVVRLLDDFDRAGSFLEEPVPTPTRSLAAGQVLAGRYRIEALVGRGGMGEVYRAHDTFVDEPLALKTLRGSLAADSEFVRRFRRELLLSRRVTHPNVCRVFDLGLHGDGSERQLHFYTMELLDGDTLSARIRRRGALPENEALPVVEQLANGLHAAHAAGIVHRDLKSANVMLCDRGAVVTDFGLARRDPASSSSDPSSIITVHPRIAGTIAYMSPEQLAGEPATIASDVYSLGVVLFEMVTGRVPFSDARVVKAAIERTADSAPDIRSLAPSLSPVWAIVIGRCLHRNPGRRYSSVLSVPTRLRTGWKSTPEA